MCEETVGRGTEIQKDMVYVHIFKQFCFVGVLVCEELREMR